MAGLEFTQPPQPSTRVTPEEARQVVALWSAEEHEANTEPSTKDLAEVLNIPEERVQELIAKVRTHAVERKSQLAWKWVIAFAVLLIVFVTIADNLRSFQQSPSPPAIAQPTRETGPTK